MGANQIKSACRGFIFLCAAMAGVAPAAAQDKAYLDEYKAYTAALEAGDAAAAAHGYAAWQAAEAELGDDSLTGVLAFNYGQLVLYSETEKALVALRRAKELQDAGVADLPAEELSLYFAYADFALDKKTTRKRNSLRDALAMLEQIGAPASPDTAAMWLSLASADLLYKRYKDAASSAQKAEAQIMKASPSEKRRLAEAIALRGVATIVPFPRGVDDVLEAHKQFSRAYMLFEPQKSIDDFDPLLAFVLAWDAAAGAALRSLGEDDYPDHEDFDKENGIYARPLFEPEELSLEECGIEWRRRKQPDYPSGALARGTIGAVVIGYRLTDNPSPQDLKILAEVPSDVFKNNVMQSFRSWALAKPPRNDPRCRENRISTFTYVIED